MLRTNSTGINLIKAYEGIEDGDPSTVNLDPYLCQAKVWTIGYGHSIFYNNKQLNKTNDPQGVIAKSLYPNGITIDQAETLLKNDIYDTEILLNNVLKNISLNENQYSALTSFVFNVGIGRFIKSTLLKRLKDKNYLAAAEEFKKWRKVGSIISNGLVKRREAEKALFLKEV